VARRLDHVVINVEAAESVDDDVVAAVAALIPQLSRSSPPPTREMLERIVEGDGTTLFVAREAGRVMGMLTLAVFSIPTGIRAWIEDVVVDESARGAGAGEALVAAALERAAAVGARSVDLTSRPSREAANRLYVRMGFELRTTNVYRFNAD
jgi:ribosomal protein S18 acetylase RimI-like enzyme